MVNLEIWKFGNLEIWKIPQRKLYKFKCLGLTNFSQPQTDTPLKQVP